MKKQLTLLFMILLITMAAVACGTGEDASGATAADETNEEETEATDDTEAAEGEAEQSGEVVVEHELGETTVTKNPENVVVFDYGVLDTLRELEVDIAAVPQGNIPHYLDEFEDSAYENAGTLFEPDFEKIYDIQPDLIIISGRSAEAYDELNDIAPTIHMGVDQENYVESFKENVTVLGEIFSKEDVVENALTDIDESIEALYNEASESDENGLIILANDGSVSAYGPGSRFGVIHEDFGITPADEQIESSTHGQNISFEYIVETDPDYIFVIDRDQAIGEDEDAGSQSIVENELVMNTKAYEEGNIIYLDPAYWYLAGGGLTSVSEMVSEIQEGIN